MAVEDTLQEVKRLHCACAVKPNLHIQFLFMGKPCRIGNVSFSCGLSNGMTQIVNFRKFTSIFIFTSKHMDRKVKSALK